MKADTKRYRSVCPPKQLWRNRVILAWLGVCSFSPTGVCGPEQGSSAQFLCKHPVKVTGCVDGDTCTVASPAGLRVRIRLAGIDAPERPQSNSFAAHGEIARRAHDTLEAHIKGERVCLRQTDLDRYNRPVVAVFKQGEPVNRLLVQKGLAEVYRGANGSPPPAAYEAAEQKARRAKRGIWQDRKERRN